MSETNLPTYYTEFNPAAQAEEDEKHAYVSNFVHFEKGRNIVRFLPPHPNMRGLLWIPVKQHFVPDKGDGKGGTVICPESLDREFRFSCPICRELNILKVRSDVDDDERRKKEVSLKLYANVLMLEVSPEGVLRAKTGAPQVLDISPALRNMLWSQSVKPATGIFIADAVTGRGELLPFSHPELGRCAVIDKGDGSQASPWWKVDLYPKDCPLPLSAIANINPDWPMLLNDIPALNQVLALDRYEAIAGKVVEALMKTSRTGGGAQLGGPRHGNLPNAQYGLPQPPTQAAPPLASPQFAAPPVSPYTISK